MEEEKAGEKKLLNLSEISLILDTYDDIFSDFDPRPFSQRALSDDFLFEAKKASRDKGEGIELRFIMPNDSRSLPTETVIKKRLKEHFKKHNLELDKESKDMVRKGAYFVLLGIVIMFLASIILFKVTMSLLTSFLTILLEPAGWFLFWEGLDIVLFESKKKIPDLQFYKKMSKAEISFTSY